tara:strand:+ start:551 stop:1291 length:741 start_codon:yes stop_codon:yes gene_type:complete
VDNQNNNSSDPPLGIIFDWDSTLIDNWCAIAHSLNLTLKKMGLQPWTYSEIRTQTKQSARDSFPDIFGSKWREALDFFYKAFESNHIQSLTPLPGAEELILNIKSHGMFMGIISNKNGTYLRKEISQLGWHRYFDRIIGASDAEKDKPAVETVVALLQGTNIKPGKEIWFVGDSVIDLQCAHLAGCLPILVKTGTITSDEILRWPPEKTFTSCLELNAEFQQLIHGYNQQDRELGHHPNRTIHRRK